MLAFTNTTHTKDQVLAQIRAHGLADEIVKGRYWVSGKGCAVGCTIHSADHAEYETRFGVPQMLARLEDRIFEGMPNDLAKSWPERFMSAIRPGQDLSLVGWKFLHWMLTDPIVNPGIEHGLVKEAVKRCADAICPLTKGEQVAGNAAAASADSARRARCAAASAATSAAANASADSAAMSAAQSAAMSAAASARSAAWSADSAAWSADSAAWSADSAAQSAGSAEVSARSAAWSADSAAASADSAAWSVRNAAYVIMSDKLIELIAAA